MGLELPILPPVEKRPSELPKMRADDELIEAVPSVQRYTFPGVPMLESISPVKTIPAVGPLICLWQNRSDPLGQEWQSKIEPLVNRGISVA